MLILLLLFSILRLHQSDPLPTADFTRCEEFEGPFTVRGTIRIFGNRQTRDIVFSCLATIFACTWTAIHPNIPRPTDSGWVRFKRQLVTTIYAILAPEAVTAWAMRQYFAAQHTAEWYNREIVRLEPPEKRSWLQRHKELVRAWFEGVPLPQPYKKGEVRPWTITHGFFLQMGGFMLCEEGMPIQRLGYMDLRDLTRKGYIDAPRTTAAEIEDRSKGDVLSKTIVVLQTTWFVTQCIARWSANIPVTELEIVTLGFAMLNALTYRLWWHKPQSVGMPVHINLKTTTEEARTFLSTTSDDFSDEIKDLFRSSSPESTQIHEHESPPITSEDSSTSPSPDPEKQQHQTPITKTSFLKRKLNQHLTESHGGTLHLIYQIPYRLTQALIRPVGKMMEFSWQDMRVNDLRVPMFYSSWIADDMAVFIWSSIISSIFGLIHLVPSWFLDYPSRSEMLLWRISAAVITVQPLVLGLWTKLENGRIFSSHAAFSPLGIVAIVGLPLYMIARVMLVVLAFISLRKLPPEAFITVDWIFFIPHV